MSYSFIGFVAILIHLILNHEYFGNREEKSESNKAFKRYLWAVLCYYITDALWGIIYDTHIIGLIYFDTVLYYVAMALTVVFLCMYVISYLNLVTIFGRFIYFFGFAFAVCDIVLLVINHFEHIFFQINSDATYQAFSLRYIVFIVQVFILFLLVIHTVYVIRRQDGIMKRRYFTIFVFCLEMMTAIIGQIFFPLLPLYSIGLLIGDSIIHIFIKEDEKIEQHKLLELKNKEVLEVNEEQYAQLEEITSLNELLRVQKESKNELHAVLESMAAIFYSLHEIDLVNDTVTEFNARNEVKEIVSHRKGAVQTMNEIMNTVISDEYKESVLKFTDLTTLADRMQNKKFIAERFVGIHIGWFLAMFIAIETDDEGKPVKVIFSTRIINEDQREKEILIRKTKTDELTGILNRRAYEEDIYEHNDIPDEDGFLYVSLDVNGLKVINDSIGHLAGDELIIGSCRCMQKAFGPYGKLYRIGGDEFVAILTVDNNSIKGILHEFDELLNNWSGKLIDSLSVSYGYVSREEFPNYSVREIASKAEKRMYEAKSAYYRRQGVDRRGQQDAHKALCELYTKILKINITEDTFHIVNMDINEQTAGKVFYDKISDWLTDFGKKGGVHPEDLEEYLKKTDLQYVKDYFSSKKTSLHIFYRRKYEDGFKQVMMELIPANDYTDDNQSLFLYVKNIDT